MKRLVKMTLFAAIILSLAGCATAPNNPAGADDSVSKLDDMPAATDKPSEMNTEIPDDTDWSFMYTEAELDWILSTYSQAEIDSLHEYLGGRIDIRSLLNEETALAYYNAIQESFPVSAESGKIIYPDYYGGAYITDDGNLVVFIRNDSEKGMWGVQELRTKAGVEEFIIRPAKYSYQELTDMMDFLNDFKIKFPDHAVAVNFNTYYLDDFENRIVVLLDDFNGEQIQLFREQVVDSPMIEFEQGTGGGIPH